MQSKDIIREGLGLLLHKIDREIVKIESRLQRIAHESVSTILLTYGLF